MEGDEETEDDFESSDDDFGDDEFADDDAIDLDSSEALDDPDYDEDADDEPVVARPAPKRRSVLKKTPTIEGVPKNKLDKPEVAEQVWQKLQARLEERPGDAPPLAYSLRTKLVVGDVVEHKVFGIGFVIEVPGPQKVEILFSNGLRKLVHNRA